MKYSQIVEICAGTAAVSLAAVGLPRFPASRIGNKAGYADAILEKMGIRPGSVSSALLVDTDVELMLLMEQIVLHPREVAKGVENLLKLGPREAWEKAGKVLVDHETFFSDSKRAARTLVRIAGARGGVGGFRGAHKLRPTANGIPFSLVERVRAFQSSVDPKHGILTEHVWITYCSDAWEFSPSSPLIQKRAVVYIDAPYEGRENYGPHKASGSVETLACKWASFGFPVYVSEAKPFALAAEFWDITNERKGQKRRSLTKNDYEFLNYFSPSKPRE